MPDKPLTGEGGNPIKSDPELQIMLKKLDSVKKYKTFQGWKTKFLDRLEQFLYEAGMKPADTASNDFSATLEKFTKKEAKVVNHMEKGELSDTKKTVKASLALNEMCNSLTTLVTGVEQLIPSVAREEKKRGFTKFHLGAVLIRQGFHQYKTMKAIEDTIVDIGEKLGDVADRQQQELFKAYVKQVQRFCDVLADLNLYEVMMKCLEFAEPPEEEESEEPETINITIETHDGKTIRLELEVTETIGNIKDAIAPGCGIDPDKQILQWKGTPLEDNDVTLEGLGIQDNAKFFVEPLRIPVTVRTMDGKSIEIMVNPSDYLSDIKRQVEDESDVPAKNQRLFMDGEELDDDMKTAENYGIKAGSVVDMEPKSMKISVETPDGKLLEIEITPSDTSDDIKAKIAEETGMPEPKQVLKFKGEELPSDGETAKDMGIRDGSKINVEIFKVPVTVNTYDGKQIKVLVDPTDYLSDIKRQLEDESGIEAPNQILFMEGDELDDNNRTAQDYGIKAGSVLDLEPNSIQVSVETPDGRKHEVEVSLSDTTDDLKGKIAEQTGMPPKTQVLKFNDQELPSDGSTVKDMGIRDGSEIKVEVFKVPVTINTMDGKKIQVMVDPTNKLIDIKKELEEESGLPANNQKLFMNGEELADDNKTAEDYGIEAGSELDLEPKRIKVSVETPDGKKHEVEIKPSDTTDDLKDKIAEQTGMPPEQQVLKFNGKELPNDASTVKDMGIRDGDEIKVEESTVPITVTDMDGEKIQVMVDPTNSMGDIKKQLEAETGVPADNQRLFMNGNELDDDNKTAKDYGIKNGSELDLEPKKIKVSVETPDGKTHEVEVKPSDTSDDIKAAITAETGMPAETQVVKFNGEELPNDGTTVKDMGIREGDVLKVEIFKVPVTVTDMDGKSVKVMVDPTDSMGDIKKQLEAETGVPADNQRLFMNGEELDDDRKTAGDYGMKPGSVLDLEPKSMKVFVETPDGKKHEVEVKPSDTSDDIKAAIAAKTGIPAETQVVKFNGKELPNDGSTVKDMGIREGDVLKVEIFKVPVTVRTMDGNTVKVMVDPTDSMGDIKKQLEAETGVPADNQRLFMNGNELDDDRKTAGDYGIKSGSVLDLEPKTMKVNIEMPDGSTQDVEIKPSYTSDDIKKAIAGQTGMAVLRQVVKFNGQELPIAKTGKTAKSLGIQDGSTLKVEIFKIPITVKTNEGKTLKLKVEPIGTIDDVKKLIKEETGMSLKKQCLKFNKNELKDGKATVEGCDIISGSELELEPKIDPIIFIDIKCQTLFAVDRETVIEKEALTPHQGNSLDFSEAAKDSATKEKIKKVLLDCQKLGVAPQIVVKATDIDDYDIQEQEAVQNKWGVKLKKREKNKKGEEFIYVDVKTEACGELARKKYIDMGFITPDLDEREKDQQKYDEYVHHIRTTFGIELVK